MASIDNNTKGLFYGGILIGAIFGVLGNFLVTFLFRIADGKVSSLLEYVSFIIVVLGFFGFGLIMYNRFVNLIKADN